MAGCKTLNFAAVQLEELRAKMEEAAKEQKRTGRQVKASTAPSKG